MLERRGIDSVNQAARRLSGSRTFHLLLSVVRTPKSLCRPFLLETDSQVLIFCSQSHFFFIITCIEPHLPSVCRERTSDLLVLVSKCVEQRGVDLAGDTHRRWVGARVRVPLLLKLTRAWGLGLMFGRPTVTLPECRLESGRVSAGGRQR